MPKIKIKTKSSNVLKFSFTETLTHSGNLTRSAFQISIQPDWPIVTIAFLTGQPWHMLKSWYTVGAGTLMDLTRGLVLSVQGCQKSSPTSLVSAGYSAWQFFRDGFF